MGISNLIPRSVKKAMLERFRKEFPAWQKELTKDYPDVELQEKHLAHLQVITDRNKMLELFPKAGIVAEIGVAQGDFSQEILSRTQPKKLHLVDVWSSERYHDGLSTLVAGKFKDQIASGQVEINRGYSTDRLPDFDEAYFDWVYIDTDHTYHTTKKKLELARPKMKKGGIMAGHDYSKGSFDTLSRYGVVEAVHEFCVNFNWELIYVTHETSRDLSFAIREIGA